MKAEKCFISIRCLATVLVLIFVITSCHKKDDESVVLPSLEGDLIFYLPLYAEVNSTIALESTPISYPAEGVIYKWSSDHMLQDTVKALNCEITVPDSLGVFGVVITASADGYYSKTATQVLTSINTGWDGSVKNRPEPTHWLMDERDGELYSYEEIGDALWLTENVRWDGAGEEYGKSKEFDKIMGRLYTWKEATGGENGEGLFGGPQGVCPEGWTLPTNEDWQYLASQLKGNGAEYAFNDRWNGLGEMVMSKATFNGEKMWQYDPDCEPQNKFNWEAYPAGRCYNNYNNYSGIFEYGYWWSASEYTSGQAYYRYLHYESPDFPAGAVGKDDFGASVRCVKKR